MYNPETNILRKTGAAEKPLEPVVDEMYELFLKDKKFIDSRQDRKQFKDINKFSDVYSRERIRSDIQYLKNRKESFGKVDHTVRGQLLETVMSEYVDMVEWFGNMSSHRASEYDDQCNGVDVILEGEGQDEKPVYLAIDCTISENKRTLDQKVRSIVNNIEKNTLSTIKYFQSDRDDFKGMLHFVPKVIIAMEPRRMEELAKECLPIMKKEKGCYKKLHNSYLQIYFLRQAEAQLKKQQELVNLPGKKHQKEVIEAINNTLEYIQKVLEKKETSLDQSVVKRGNKEFEASEVNSSL